MEEESEELFSNDALAEEIDNEEPSLDDLPL
jgi:hypothetical protein